MKVKEKSRVGEYRYGFNGMEKDDEIKGSGNSYDFGNRIYDPRLGRWLSTDAYASKYPSLSPYNFGANNPITNIDVAGDSIWVTTKTQQIGDKTVITRTIHTTIAVLNTSDDVHDMKKVTESIKSGLVNSLTMYDVGGAGPNVVVNYKADVQVRAVTDMSQVDPTDHLMVIVDDVTYDDGIFSNTVGVAKMSGQISYIETTSWLNDRSFDDMIRTAIHEWGHNAGLGHQFDDPTNHMSYSSTRNQFSSDQLTNIYGDALNGRLNQGGNYEKSSKSSNNWFWNTSTNEAPYDFNVKKGEKIPKTIEDK